jgi:hypothetical protein
MVVSIYLFGVQLQHTYIIGIVFYILSASILLTFVLPFYVELKSNLISSTAGEMQYSTSI